MLTGGTLDRQSIKCNLKLSSAFFRAEIGSVVMRFISCRGGGASCCSRTDGRVARGRIRKGKRETGCGDLLARRLERTIAPGA